VLGGAARGFGKAATHVRDDAAAGGEGGDNVGAVTTPPSAAAEAEIGLSDPSTYSRSFPHGLRKRHLLRKANPVA